MSNLPPGAARPRGTGHRGKIATGAYLLLAITFLHDVALTTRSYLFRDILLWFHPERSAVAQSLREGHWPLWTHDTLCGSPLGGGVAGGLLYPPNWLYPLLPFDFALTLGMLLHLVVAAATMRGFLRRLGLHESSAFLGGALFGFGTWTMTALASPVGLGSAVWLPLLWSGVWDAMVNGTRRGLAWSSFAVAMSLLAGGGPLTLAALGSAGLLAAALAPGVARDPSLSAARRIHRWGTLPVALIIGLLVSGGPFLPSLGGAGPATTPAPAPAVEPLPALPAQGLLGLVDPFALGFPGAGRFWGGDGGTFRGGAFYTGALALLLVGGSAPAFRRFRRRRRLSREDVAAPPEMPIAPRPVPFFLLGGALIGFALLLVPPRALSGLLIGRFPGLAWPDLLASTAAYLVAAHLSALAAIGLQSIRRDRVWIRRASWSAIALGGMMLITWALVRGPLTGVARAVLLAGAGPDAQFAWEAAHLDWLATLPMRGAIPMLAGALGLTLASIRWRVPMAWSVLLVLDLFLAGRGLDFPTARGVYDETTAGAAALREELAGRRLLTPESLDRHGAALRGADGVDAYRWAKGAMLGNTNVPAGVAQARGRHRTASARHRTLARIFEDPATSAATRERLLDLWDVGIRLEPTDGVALVAAGSGTTEHGAGFRLIPHSPSIGRATLVSGWKTVEDDAAGLDELLSPSHDPRRRALIEVPTGVPALSENDRRASRRAERVEYEQDRNSIQVAWHVGDGGLLRVLESWDPGWQALVNGDLVPVYRADYLFLAVPVPAGSVRVELNYRPPGVRNSLIASGVGILLLIAAFVSGRRVEVEEEDIP